MKKVIYIGLLMFLSVFLISCNKNKDTYETFKAQHLSVRESFNQDYEEYYLYFYSNTCPHCNNIKKIIFKQAKNEELPLFFINGRDVAGILNFTDDPTYTNYGVTKFSDLKLLGYPTLLLIRNGRVIVQFTGQDEIRKELS